MKKYILLLILPFILLFFGCGKIVNPIFESKIVETLNQHIKAEKWTCKIIGDPNYQKQSVPNLTLIGDKINYKNVIIDKMELNFKNVSINLDKSIKSCESANGEITISDDAISELIKGYIKHIDNPTIEVRKKQIGIKGEITILNKTLDLEVFGNMEIKDGVNIIVEPEYFKVYKFGVTVPGVAKQFICDKINPIYKITNNPYNFYITDFNYSDGYIHAKGTFDAVKIMDLFDN